MVNLEIGGKKIGEDYDRTFIIAEAGSNHNQKFDQAKELINVAADSGADAIKFQTYSAKKLYSKKTPPFPGEKKQPYDVIRDVEIPREWQSELTRYAEKSGLIFLSTPFDYEAVDELEELGISAYKWASSTITDFPMLKYTAKKNKPLIISTGMANMGEIQEAINVAKEVGNDQIVLLQCTSTYPAKPEEINLRAMNTIKNAFNLPTGLSDHSLGISIPIAAVARGAVMVEKHFTLDRDLEGPDHKFALEPDELDEMVTAIRNVEKGLGSPEKKPTEREKEKLDLTRRSIIAKRDIAKGEKIEKDMLVVKRPGLGIEPKFKEIVVGRKAKQDIEKEQWITWEMV